VGGSNLLSGKAMNNLVYHRIALALTVTLLLGGCSRMADPGPDRLGLGYFPLQVGEVRLYQVLEKHWRNNQIFLVRDYQLRESVTGSFENLEGGTSYLLERAIKPAGSAQWTIDSLWTARVDPYRAILVKNNRPVVVFVFPPDENKTWNANSMNASGAQEYRMVDVGRPFGDGSLPLGGERTVTVIQSDNDDIVVETDLRKEVFGYETGLVYKDIEHKLFEGFGANRIIVSGLEYRQSLIAYEPPD
jgi:hypothetical protein